ncbi:tRNA pseudouridine(55) synthase TruB [Paenibacillus larvae]
MTWEGILPVYKPEGFTSHDVVAKMRRILGMKRIGHTGTLDPSVTGVLPLCLGRATRLVEYIQELPKEYEATLQIGIATDTEDATGTIIEQAEQVQLEEGQVIRVLESFVGSIRQVPPMYSAVRVNGKRLYELAREGKEVERKSREVYIYSISDVYMDLSLRFPEVRFKVKCSKGTYIRTLCVDIGKKLRYPATMKRLVRSSTGAIGLEQCITLEEAAKLVQKGLLHEKLIPMDQAVFHLPKVQLTAVQSGNALQGKKITLISVLSVGVSGEKLFRAYGPNDKFLGIFEWKCDQHLLQPVKVFL